MNWSLFWTIGLGVTVAPLVILLVLVSVLYILKGVAILIFNRDFWKTLWLVIGHLLLFLVGRDLLNGSLKIDSDVFVGICFVVFIFFIPLYPKFVPLYFKRMDDWFEFTFKAGVKKTLKVNCPNLYEWIYPNKQRERILIAALSLTLVVLLAINVLFL